MREEGRRRLVTGLKIALPLFALGVFASLFVFSSARFDGRISFDGVDLSALDEGLKIANPRFTGATKRGEPFTVSAVSATPDGPRPERVGLEAAEARIDLAGGRAVTASAASGVLLPREDRVELSGGVRVETSDGYALAAEEARLDIEAERLDASGGVTAEGPFGRIEARRLRAERAPDGDGAYIWFEEAVKVRIDSAAMAAQRG